MGFQANELLLPILGVGEFPYVPMPPIPFPPREKVPAIDTYVGDRAAAWIDDVIVPDARTRASNRERPTKLMEVDHTRGLQRHHVDDLLAWASNLQTSKDPD